MITEAQVYHDGEMPYTYSTNLSFIKPVPDIPIKVSLKYFEGYKDEPRLPSRKEIQAIHFRANGILISYAEEKIENSQARGWRRMVHMFRKQTHVIDDSFRSDMT